MKKNKSFFNPADFETLKKIALEFPATEESISYGTPAVKVKGKLMCRLHDSGEFIPIRLDFNHHDQYLASHPELFHLPDHYKNYPAICLWTGKRNQKIIREVLELSWRGLASAKQIKEFEKTGSM